MILIILVLLLIVLINIPFGYWRANVVKFSVQWFVAIHLPVPWIAYFRNKMGLAETGYTMMFFLVAYFLGQYLGSGISKRFRRYGQVSSHLLYDLIRRTWVIFIRR